MKTVPLSEIEKIDFVVNDISSIHQLPIYRSFTTTSRTCNGFLLIDQGECLYTWDTGKAWLKPGAIIYLPLASNHRMKVISENISFYRVNFTITDMVDRENVVFTKCPWLVTVCAGKYVVDMIHELTNIFFRPENTLQKTSLLCNILFDLKKSTSGIRSSKIAPAVDFIDRHYCEDIKCEDLSRLCNCSRATMYRYFNEELGETPIEYKNRLRIERACFLLKDGECTVSEISSMLGFNSIYYFSRIFKKYIGLSPTAYISHKEKRNKTNIG